MSNQNVHIIKVVRYLIRSFQRAEATPSVEDKDALWLKICQEADRNAELRNRRIRLRRLVWGVAASVLVVLSVGFFAKYMLDETPDIEEVAVNLLSESRSEESEQPLLVMSPDRVIPLQNHTKVEYSADGQVSLKSKNEISRLEKVEKKKDKIIRRLEAGRFQPPIHLVTLPEERGRQLEICSSLLFLQPSFPDRDFFVVGIAKDHEDALELVEKIVREVYNETKGTDVRSYILNREQEE